MNIWKCWRLILFGDCLENMKIIMEAEQYLITKIFIWKKCTLAVAICLEDGWDLWRESISKSKEAERGGGTFPPTSYNMMSHHWCDDSIESGRWLQNPLASRVTFETLNPFWFQLIVWTKVSHNWKLNQCIIPKLTIVQGMCFNFCEILI